MARNEEKAQSMLNRFLRLKEGESRYSDKRPYLSSQCDTLVDADKWRRQILREIQKGITEIQNSALDEFKIRDLNDHINKLTREKHQWEKRIIELGGPNYIGAASNRIFDADGKLPLGDGLYKYYGAAKTLPGIKELFEKPTTQEAAVNLSKKKSQLVQNTDSDYYGYRDDDDNGLLESIEKKYELEAIQREIQRWKRNQADKISMKNSGNPQKPSKNNEEMDIDQDEEEQEEDTDKNVDNSNNTVFKYHVDLPSKEEFSKIVLEKKKQDLRERYLK